MVGPNFYPLLKRSTHFSFVRFMGDTFIARIQQSIMNDCVLAFPPLKTQSGKSNVGSELIQIAPPVPFDVGLDEVTSWPWGLI